MKQYKFRVCAVNEEGESDPCTMKDFITAKDPFGEPGPPIDLVELLIVDLSNTVNLGILDRPWHTAPLLC